MSTVVLEAAEYNAATDRVSSALQLLRDEMKSLRHQDLTLMRQLITISDSIKSLGQDQRGAKTLAKRNRNKTRHIASINSTTPCSKRQTPLVRQQSLPRYCDVIPEVHERRGSISSEDDSQDESWSDSMASLDDDTCEATDMSSAIPVFQRPVLTRQRSRSMKDQPTSTPKPVESDNTVYEGILNKNVQLWKQSQTEQDDSDSSVFENDSDSE